MSDDQIKQNIDRLTKSGRLDRAVAKEIEKHPIEGDKILRLNNIQETVDRHSDLLRKFEIALFGDTHLGINGLIVDNRSLKLTIFKSTYMIVGGMAVCSFFLGLLGLWIEYSKH